MHHPGGGKAEARGPAVSESVLCLCPSAVRDAPARSLYPMLTCCLTVLFQECLKGTTMRPRGTMLETLYPLLILKEKALCFIPVLTILVL